MEPRYQGGIVNRGAATTADIDAGLRAYMLKVYNYMAVGMVLTAVVAFAVVNVPAISQLFYQTFTAANGLTYTKLTILGWIALFAPMIMGTASFIGTPNLAFRQEFEYFRENKKVDQIRYQQI